MVNHLRLIIKSYSVLQNNTYKRFIYYVGYMHINNLEGFKNYLRFMNIIDVNKYILIAEK